MRSLKARRFSPTTAGSSWALCFASLPLEPTSTWGQLAVVAVAVVVLLARTAGLELGSVETTTLFQLLTQAEGELLRCN